ncbi:division/cell wall cluster transcriptional repressor MraZ [Siculibacillus lacustris]|nr:division/cell wall cluster transcriptional repressor MraZ [Siculibacillus lacustris]
MQRFLGRHAKRIDAKGRVSVPAAFRAVLAADRLDGPFCLRALGHPAIEAGGRALIAAIDARLADFPLFSPAHTALATTLLGQSEAIGVDPEGRMSVPEWIRDATGIDREMVFVGLGDRFQIWEPSRFAVFETAARVAAERLLAGLPATEGGA